MLRVSSLGLTFTHGISRSSLLQYPRCIHRSPFHEPTSLVFGVTRFCSTSKAEVSPMLAMAEPSQHVPASHSVPPPFETPVLPCNNVTTSRTTTKMPTGHCRRRNRDMTSSNNEIRRGPSVGHRPPEPSQQTRSGFPPSLSRKAYIVHMSRRPMYNKLAQATDVDTAWQTYQDLLRNHPKHITQIIPHKYLHSFAALLVSASKWRPPEKTRTQKVFLRLLSVLQTIYHTGGQLRLWEWNALIQCAGRGWRKTRIEDFQSSLNIFRDMTANRVPGASFSDDPFNTLHASRVLSKPVEPDIVSYTTLLAIACRTLSQPTLERAESMLISSGLSPNRVTYLAYIRFYARRGELMQVRFVLSRMREKALELGIDGLNGCIWAYGRNGRLDISALIYRILRHNMLSDSGLSPEDDVEDAIRELYELEGLTVPTGLQPDAITYYTLIQVHMYRGHLSLGLRVLKDMMTSPRPVTGKLEDADVIVSGPTLPHPTLPIFRAIFLAFARHAVQVGYTDSSTTPAPHMRPAQDWTLKQLQVLFDNFMGLPNDSKPNSRTMWSLLVAFAISSGYDRELLRSVWEKIAGRYGERWDGRVAEFRRKIYDEKFDRAYFEEVRIRRGRIYKRVRVRAPVD